MMMKRKAYILVLIILILLSVTSYAVSLNSLCVFKLHNKDERHVILPGSGPLPKPGDFAANNLVPVAGSKLNLYKVTSSNKAYYDGLTEAELGTPLKEGVTDAEGKVCFSNLEDGFYYLKDVSADDYQALTILIEMPYEYDGVIFRDLIGYLKVIPVDGTGGPGPDPEPDPEPEPGPNEPPGDLPPLPLGRSFIKVDNSDEQKPLSGAAFKVVQKTEEGSFEPILKDGSEYITTSGEDGMFYVTGIGKGEFYLVETVAPTDEMYKYKLLQHPLKFSITESSIVEEPICVENAPLASLDEGVPPTGIVIPKTGDIQIVLYLVLGGLLFTTGLYIYMIEDKKLRLEGNQ